MFSAPLALLLIAQPVQAKPIVFRPAPLAPAPAPSDEQIIKDNQLKSDGDALLAFFRHRITPQAEAERLTKLGQQLGDKSAEVRDKASAELVGLGPLASPTLRRIVNHADSEETVSRARKCLNAIEGANGSTVVQSAVRLLAARHPDGATEALINYLPFANDDAVVQEIETALTTVGLRDGKLDSPLVRALTDPTPIRRSLAAQVVSQIGGTSGRKLVRPLLKDAKPSVRMQAALSLANSHDAEALPVLIDLVANLPLDGRQRVEGYLIELAGEWAVKTPQGGDNVSSRLRRQLWTTWWETLDGKQLLEEFSSRTLSDEERTRALAALEKLDNVSADVRAKAVEELIALGPRTASLLRQHLEHNNPRLAGAIRQCLKALEGDNVKPLPEAAPRLLALRRPEGAVEALLAYVPFAENQSQSEQIGELLASIGCTDGKADAALVRALEDKISTRRAAAAVSLCKGGAEDELPAVRKLLRDSDALVRMRTGLALAQHGDKSAVPVLIAVLADLPSERVWEVEESLLTLAGEKAPSARVGNTKESRAEAVAAWKGWWQKEEKNVDLARLTDLQRDSGLLLAIESQFGRVSEMTRDYKVRWKIEGLQWPMDAVVCPNGNVFVIHQSGNVLSMRDRQGKELWQKHVNQAFHCQRLRNGHLFVVGRNQIFEFDVHGKEISSSMQPLGWIVGGRKFPNGHVGLFTQQGQYVRLDAAGKRVKTFQVAFNGGVAMTADLLPNDGLVATLNTGQVVEYDDKGQALWQTNVINPGFPLRLANGHTLVMQNGSKHLYELDRKGKVVTEKNDLECQAWRIRRR